MKYLRRKRKIKLSDYGHFLILVVLLDFFLISNLLRVDMTYASIDAGIKLDMIGDVNQVLQINTDYVDSGVKVTVDDQELTLDDMDYSIENNVDSSAVGDYKVKYHVIYDNKNYDLIRNVTVVDTTPPEINILTSKVSKNSCGNNLKYYAIDNYDGILTDKVSVIEENGLFKLTVTDSSGNKTEKTVPVSETINDYVLELVGNLYTYVKVGQDYIDEGAKVTNICGKVLDVPYQVDGDVDTSTPGEYTIYYRVNGVDAYQMRKVVVYNNYNQPQITSDEEKVIYLTFDDGPGVYTEELLNILDKYNVKATFFVTAQFNKYLPLLKREASSGHVVALHTYTHNWNLYRSFANYYKDFNEMNKKIEEYTGSKTKLFRFPGGGSNTISKGKATGVVSYIASRMQEEGYTYFDWNVDSGDAAGANSSKIYNNVISGISERNYSVVLMHDIKRPTIDTIEKIIVYALDNGYTFKTLSSNSPTVHHHVNN
ncbi:MAG: polysaccharide deacetylase [Bacilli bacterium]|nr:polysaccharide deacetylase [Bacilli bacterium]